MPAFDHFDFLAPIYEKVITSEINATLSSLLEDTPAEEVLIDIGGGTGRVAKHLTSRLNRIIVVDASIKMLSQVNGIEGIHPVCSLAEKLPLKDEIAGTIIMVDAFHHLKTHAEVVDEIWRILRPGGRIIIEEPDIRTSAVKFIAIMEKLALMRSKFFQPLQLAEFFNFPGAEVIIESEANNSWVVISKKQK